MTGRIQDPDRETGTDWTMPATVKRSIAPSGNRDHDRFYAECDTCSWHGAFHSNRTVEGQRLADRDARQHSCQAVDDDARRAFLAILRQG